jgi:peroxiredoxin
LIAIALPSQFDGAPAAPTPIVSVRAQSSSSSAGRATFSSRTRSGWTLPVAAAYVIDRNGTIIYAHTDPDYRDRADPREVLNVLTKKVAAA